MRELVISFLFVIALFFAGGVYSQFSEGQVTDESIENGMNYLNNQSSLDSAIFVLFLANQNDPNLEIDSIIETKTAELDDYHYPLKQFLSGQTIDESEIDPETLKSAYYQNFIGYFSCKPLTLEWIQQINLVTEAEFTAYDSAHALLLFQLIKNDYFGGRCGDYPELLGEIDNKLLEKIQLTSFQLSEKENFDAWVERVAVLGFAGELISPEDVQYIYSKQMPSGGWKPVDYYADEEVSSHTTALAVWALTEAST